VSVTDNPELASGGHPYRFMSLNTQSNQTQSYRVQLRTGALSTSTQPLFLVFEQVLHGLGSGQIQILGYPIEDEENAGHCFIDTANDRLLATCQAGSLGSTDLVQPEKLGTRIRFWVDEEIALGTLHEKTGLILEAILYRGELPRGDVAGLLDVSSRTASRVVSGLIDHDVVVSESSKAPLRIHLPAKLAPRWMPGLFPEQVEGRLPPVSTGSLRRTANTARG